MKISTKSRYGIRMLIDMYENMSESPMRLADIAQRQEVSQHYLEQVASDLKRAGIIYSVKGPQGGYFLSKDADEIIIGDVIRILEGDILLTDSHMQNDSILQQTINKSVYNKLNSRIKDLVDSISLKGLVERK
ncbi:MAG: Rrf2 family transcriptional regulator [Eubacteriales bacterium]